MTQKKSSPYVSCGASLLMALYVAIAAYNLYRLMHPLSAVDVASEPADQMIHPLWKQQEQDDLHLEVYLSTSKAFQARFLHRNQTSEDVALLWSQAFDQPSLQRAFLITNNEQEDDESYKFANSWLEQVQQQEDEGLLSTLAGAGQGIESTSILLTFYTNIIQRFSKLFGFKPEDTPVEDRTPHRVTLSLDSPVWKSLSRNATIYVHALLVRKDETLEWPPTHDDEVQNALRQASLSHSFLFGKVNMIKHEPPHHIVQPGRVLIHDFVYIFRKYILGNDDLLPPWDLEAWKPSEYEQFAMSRRMKEDKAGYPYWKPEVSVKLISDQESYPMWLAESSGMPLVRLPRRSLAHPTGLAFTPALHVDEIGLTSEKYIPINETVTTLPLIVTFDRSDMESSSKRGTTATAGGMSPARWRLLTHLSDAIEAQKDLGFEQSDIDDLRRLIADTNVTLLAVTMLASALHLLFEFLTFKSEVSFWKNNRDLTGLSVRALFLDMASQTVILLYLIEKDSSLLMTIPSAVGCLIALWKCQRASGLRLGRASKAKDDESMFLLNKLLRVVGFELQVPRLEVKKSGSPSGVSQSKDLVTLTIESDRLATHMLGAILLPMVAAYAVYSLCREEHLGWYSWFITTASSAVYALGFVLMTPQLFLNWKLKSVAHLPWRVLVYRTLNTFVDDLFSFVIRMPAMARISCFRDDVVFFIYLYQRWMYPVDASRPVEGGGDGLSSSPAADDNKKNN